MGSPYYSFPIVFNSEIYFLFYRVTLFYIGHIFLSFEVFEYIINDDHKIVFLFVFW